MFDTLTLDQLYAMHNGLYLHHRTVHARMVGPDMQPVISPLSDDWNILSAKCAEIRETMTAVNAEIQHRETEIGSPANQSGPYAYIHEDQHMSGE